MGENVAKWTRICGDQDIGRTEMMQIEGGKLYRTFGKYQSGEAYELDGSVAMVFVPDQPPVIHHHTKVGLSADDLHALQGRR